MRDVLVGLALLACACGGRSKMVSPPSPGADAAVLPPGPDVPVDRPADVPARELGPGVPEALPVDRPPFLPEAGAESRPNDLAVDPPAVTADVRPPIPDGLPEVRPPFDVPPIPLDLPPIVPDVPREAPPLVPDVPREAPFDLPPDLPPVRPDVPPDLLVDLLAPRTDAWPPLPVCVDGAACTTGCSTACGMIGIMACGCNGGVLSCSSCQLLPITVSPDPCPGNPNGQECTAGGVACIAYRAGAIGGACLCMSPTAGGTLRWSCILQ